MTNERILVPCVYQLSVGFFARPACQRVSCAIAFLACSPAGVLLSRCFCCSDGWRVLARTNVDRHEGSDMWIYDSRACGGSRGAQASSAVAGVVASTRVALRALGCAIG